MRQLKRYATQKIQTKDTKLKFSKQLNEKAGNNVFACSLENDQKLTFKHQLLIQDP